MSGPATPEGWLETVVVPRTSDIGGFEVRRALPSVRKRMVGPFVFLDQMGPAVLKAGHGIDVRPHPHIGLATVTYLFDGEILHRDSLGTVLPIRPGEVNWMTAGRGIAHSERSAAGERGRDRLLSGIQSWVALPHTHEETDPGFVHLGADELPVVEGEGKRLRVVAGEAYGVRAPTPLLWDTLYVDVVMDAGARLPVDCVTEERALYIADGTVTIFGDRFEAGRLLVLRPGEPATVEAETDARLILLGGAVMDGPRHIWWNFVSSSQDRIEQAKADWKAGKFDTVPGETEFIPLPEK
ncbi:pirin family protein [Azospirillum canadense]|uniref:pirin family protein n=1 Tax=Azospirillum canadense TaxID=403962 RepID=UPI0022268922|nr:pirin family protein [Azospirillum canadense]MCW2235794.1 redox-sensitive bicupin YhaK (pirin superfamily) [Azospirillum canadense]